MAAQNVAAYTPVDVNADGAAADEAGLYGGFSIYNTGEGASALVKIYDNDSEASGLLLDVISLSAGQSARENYMPAIRVDSGVWVEVVTGTVEGSIRVML